MLNVLVLGASARAAAFSALRAGLTPACVDLFADRDLSAIAPARRIEAADYPEGLARLADEFPPSPWIYTGGIENHPELVDRIARRRPLWGNNGATLRAARDPFALADVLQRAGLPGPRVQADATNLPRDGSWLVKPLASTGGGGVRLLDENVRIPRRPMCYQERIAGPSFAALYLGRRTGASLVGATRQGIGRPEAPFAYRGSIGPWPLPAQVVGRVATVGDVLAAAFGLAGLFGVDFLLHDGRPWPVELNPRYTASVEVLELALGRALLTEHRRACDPTFAEMAMAERPPPRPRIVGKHIVFAPCRCRFAREIDGRRPDCTFAVPWWADLPHPGTRFEAGAPVLTVFARGSSPAECAHRLTRKVALWEDRLRRWSEDGS